MEKLYRQGAYRWMIFAIGLGLFIWLWVTAGHVRHPGAKKHKWAVVASRMLVVAGSLFFARLVFLTHEERIPVVYISVPGTGLGGEDTITSLRYLRKRGYEDIPIDDVVMFIREARYVPKKAFAAVIEFENVDELRNIVADDIPHLVVMFPKEALEKTSLEIELPYAITPAARFVKPDNPLDELIRTRRIGKKIFGKEIQCGLLESLSSDEIRRTARRSGYLCFFDGHGYNRFGDEPHLVRLLDLTKVIAEGGGSRLWLCLQLFRGKFIFWPLAAIARVNRCS